MVNGHSTYDRFVTRPRDDWLHVNHPHHIQALVDYLHEPFDPRYDVAITRTVRGQLLGGCLYQRYNGRSIYMHVAGVTPHWLTRTGLYVAFHYPFEQLRVFKIIATVPSNNHRALVFDYKLGFVEEHRIAGAVVGGDLVILSMQRPQCRWLEHVPKNLHILNHKEGSHGQQRADAPIA